MFCCFGKKVNDSISFDEEEGGGEAAAITVHKAVILAESRFSIWGIERTDYKLSRYTAVGRHSEASLALSFSYMGIDKERYYAVQQIATETPKRHRRLEKSDSASGSSLLLSRKEAKKRGLALPAHIKPGFTGFAACSEEKGKVYLIQPEGENAFARKLSGSYLEKSTLPQDQISVNLEARTLHKLTPDEFAVLNFTEKAFSNEIWGIISDKRRVTATFGVAKGAFSPGRKEGWKTAVSLYHPYCKDDGFVFLIQPEERWVYPHIETQR